MPKEIINDGKELLSQAKSKMEKTLEVLKKEFVTLRAGRANPQILDRVTVDYYGQPTPVSQVGNISSPEPRMLLISPWDPKDIPAIEKAIQKSDLGINPTNDGKVVRLVIPELNEERRKELTKSVKKMAEEAKVAVRSVRRDAIEHAKKMKKDGLMTEDDQKKSEDELQKLTDNEIKSIDKLASEKEKEIMSV